MLGSDDGVSVELLGLVELAREVPYIFDLVVIYEEVFAHLNLLINLGTNGENQNVVTQSGRDRLRLKSLLRYRLRQLLPEVLSSMLRRCRSNYVRQ